jgi:chloramphenicol 3-O-phosphotransferase
MGHGKIILISGTSSLGESILAKGLQKSLAASARIQPKSY